MSRKSRIIIVGSGIVGASTAYHLAQLGWRDMLIIDQGPLFETGGSTSHAPGGVFQTNPSRMMCKFAQYTVDLLRSLSYEGKPAYHTVGGIEVSKTKERHEDLYRKLGIAHSYGLTDAKIISPDEVLKMSPYIDPDKIHGGYYVPKDGHSLIGTKAFASTSDQRTIPIKIVKPIFYDEENKRLVS